MFASLNEKLEAVFKRLKGKGFLTSGDIDIAMKEIRLALLEADVNFKVVKGFVERVKVKSLGAQVLESLTPGQQVVKIVNDELCLLLGAENEKIRLSPNPPTVVLMAGLQGSGKTTTTAKIALHFKTQGRRPMMVAADLQRPAAIDQLITLGKQIGVPVFFSKEEKNPVKVCRDAITEAKKEARDIVFVDTAGRLHIDDELMGQLKDIKDAVQPTETLFVADSMTGQDAVNIAHTFNERIGVDGIVLTKMDGDARGGAAISIREVTGKPIKFIGTGEKIDMIEPFYPERIASRILGMGDVLSFIEKAQQTFDEKDAEKFKDKLLTDSFTLDDLRDQLSKIRSMGPIQNLLNMIPGFNRMKGVEVDEKQFVRIEAMINSMTKKEKRNPDILNGSRKIRISKGSGTTVADVNRLLKQYKDMKKMMKMFKGKKGFKMPDFMPF
ncbi:MAG: signal recognition particle protein [Nitrospirae bacterium]|nr:signal recognition particle protein [Nitrospirota bacterium]MBF0536033.1 signal recognition particle protein [Nitrospirota bacterium]MBF0617921.1 signal recognition particle protein [Nitrospirota bacterium]